MKLRIYNLQSRRQCGRMGRALDLQFVGPRFKSSTLLLTRFVLGCTLYISNIVIKITMFCNVNVQFVSMDKKSISQTIQCKIPLSFIIIIFKYTGFILNQSGIIQSSRDLYLRGLTKPLKLYYCTFVPLPSASSSGC